MPHLGIRLLGSFEVELDSRPILSFPTTKVRALLAYLCVEADQAHRRDSLASLLWPDWPQRSARTNLRNALANLRTAVGDRHARPAFLAITRDAIQFNKGSDHWLDVAAFTALVGGEQRDEEAIRLLEEAISLYRGNFLEGFSLPDSAPFEDWSVVVRERLHGTHLSALQQLADLYEHSGDLSRACDLARRRLEMEPWLEEAHRAVMRLLALSGRRGAALAQYEVCSRSLKTELAVEPSSETVRLREAIRDGTLASPAVKVPEPAAASGALPLPAGTPREAIADAHPPTHGQPASPAGPPPLSGERRFVTALFADVTGGAEYLALVGTERWAHVMGQMLRGLRGAVERFEGEVLERRQHGLLALFGARRAHEDDAERAILAAVAMQESLRQLTASLPESRAADLGLRVGVRTGEVIARPHPEDAGRGDGGGWGRPHSWRRRYRQWPGQAMSSQAKPLTASRRRCSTGSP